MAAEFMLGALALGIIVVMVVVMMSSRGDSSRRGARIAADKTYPTKAPVGGVSDRTPPGQVLAQTPIDGAPERVALSPDGRLAYVTDRIHGGDLWAIDTRTYEVAARIPVGESNDFLAVSPDGRRVYITHGCKVSVIDTALNRVTASIDVSDRATGVEVWSVGRARFTGVAVSPDGRTLYVTYRTRDTDEQHHGVMSVIDTATNQVTDTVAVLSWSNDVAVAPDGRRVYVANEYDKCVLVIDTSTNQVIEQVYVKGGPLRLAVTPDSKHVYVSHREYDTNAAVDFVDCGVAVIDTSTHTVTRRIDVAGSPEGIAITADGRKAHVAQSFGRALTVIDTSTNTITTSITVGRDSFRDFAVMPDGRRAFVPITTARSDYGVVTVLAL